MITILAIPPGEKGPKLSGWQQPDFRPPAVPDGWNKGLRLDGMTVIDCDTPEAVTWWLEHGPATPYQSQGNPERRSFWYGGEATAPGYYVWALPDGSKAGEVRVGHKVQCVIPPSVHPDGYTYQWIGPNVLTGEEQLPKWTGELPPKWSSVGPVAWSEVNADREWSEVVCVERRPNETCPAWDGHKTGAANLSLGVQVTEDGLIKASCFAGCDFWEVVELLVAEGRYEREELWPRGRERMTAEQWDEAEVEHLLRQIEWKLVKRPVLPTRVSWGQLHDLWIPPARWIVPGVIPDGLTVLAGPRKVGKSWLTGQLACAVASGTEFLGIPLEAGDALYLALEDPLRRLQHRLPAAPDRQSAERLSLWTAAPRLDRGLVAEIEAWHRSVDAPRAVVVDTLGLVRPQRDAVGRSDGGYEDAYEDIRALKEWADDTGVGVVVIHHVRKGSDKEHPLDRVLGSGGLTAAADTILVLDRPLEGDHGTLEGTGRDMEDMRMSLRFDAENCRWSKSDLLSYREIMDVYGVTQSVARRWRTAAAKSDDPAEALVRLAAGQ